MKRWMAWSATSPVTALAALALNKPLRRVVFAAVDNLGVPNTRGGCEWGDGLYDFPVATEWELLSREPQGRAGRRILVAKTFRLPDGSEKTFTVAENAAGTAAAVVALTTRGTIVLAEQYRPGPERVMAELPGGAVEPGESLADGAARELAEETGYVPGELTYLGQMRYDAYSGMVRHYFLGTGCELRHEQRLDPGEFVTVREVSPADLLTLAMTAALTDPGGVLLALPYLTGDAQVRALLTSPPR